MKNSIIILAAAIGLAAAVPYHNHHARHAHHNEIKRDETATATADTEYVAGPTVVMYSLNGEIISEADVIEGIKNGTLVWADGAPSFASSSDVVSSTSSKASSSTSFSTSTTASAAVTSTATFSSTSSGQNAWDWVTSEIGNIGSSSTSTSSASSSSSTSSSTSSSASSSSSGISKTFPDGEISCSDFPSDYGAVALSYLGLGGWTGIQSPGSTTSSGFTDIETITSSTCSGSDCCADGMYCSYACPAGYQKGHWPTTQGSTGQSVGGLLCKNGKLYKTNDDHDTLCITGTSEVTVLIRNEMSDSAAVCRTDYPGTESETVPVTAAAGATTNLTCPDSTYYEWTGKTTSAQYYVNPAGVSTEDGCQWGSDANPWGNYAPLNLGVGYSAGSAWLSIFQNTPTTEETLDFTVTLEGDGMSGYCKYSDGEYCSGENYDDCSSTGCTVSISSGTVYFVFSD